MIQEKNSRKAIKAIQDLIIEGRRMSYENVSIDIIATFLDEIEYLPGLILEEKVRDDVFEEYLKGICEKYSCNQIILRYNDYQK